TVSIASCAGSPAGWPCTPIPVMAEDVGTNVDPPEASARAAVSAGLRFGRVGETLSGLPDAPSATHLRPSERAGADDLAARLAREMAARWHRGERPPAEEFLARHPALVRDPEAALDLVYEEVCLRREFDEEQPVAALLARFPRWREPLRVLLDC